MPVMACLALIVGAPSAGAQFAVCNQTLDVVNVAVGRDVSGGSAPVFETEGWWVVGPNRCANVIRDELQARYVYIHAQDAFGQPILAGQTQLCVALRRFRVQGEAQCWARGLVAAPFHEVDTLRNARWTLFLTRDP
jgi:uncharacterized membrane protein